MAAPSLIGNNEADFRVRDQENPVLRDNFFPFRIAKIFFLESKNRLDEIRVPENEITYRFRKENMRTPDEIRCLAAKHGIKNQELADASGKSISIVWKLLTGAEKRIAYESVQAISDGLDKLIPAAAKETTQ